jgi:hypothetical protein
MISKMQKKEHMSQRDHDCDSQSPRAQGFGDLETSETQRECQNFDAISEGDVLFLCKRRPGGGGDARFLGDGICVNDTNAPQKRKTEWRRRHAKGSA